MGWFSQNEDRIREVTSQKILDVMEEVHDPEIWAEAAEVVADEVSNLKEACRKAEAREAAEAGHRKKKKKWF